MANFDGVENPSGVVSGDKTLDTHGGTNFLGTPQVPGLQDADKLEIVASLNSYRREAQEARQGGMNPRDMKWKNNLDLYWGRQDFSKKADWQAKVNMPEVASYVDRFAAAMKEALMAVPEGFYSVIDPADKENDLASSIKRATDVWLTTVGRNQLGQLVNFGSVFEEQVKLGALMASASVTTWKNDVPNGRVAIESVDPQLVWLDHTYRNLYRIRRIELDAYELKGMKNLIDKSGTPIFDKYEMERLEMNLFQKRIADADRTGTGQQINSGRHPVILDEYIATVLSSDGRVISDRAYMVLANEQFLIRGPEKNPFWHGKDWLTYTPYVTAPLSPYGRSYMEDFGAIAETFTVLTNMLIDAVQTHSMNAYAMVPSMLLNPNQALEGLSPNKVFLLDDGYKVEDFAKQLQLGQLSPDAVKLWSTIKGELSEAADMNEIGLGQFAPKGRTSATEINSTQQSSSALIRSVAQTVETRWLDPTLDLVWKTGIQHAKADDPMLMAAVGEEMWPALMSNRKALVRRPVTFQARGISTIIARQQLLKSLLSILQIVSANQSLMQVFQQKVDPEKLFNLIFLLSNIDISKLAMSQRQTMIQGLAQPMEQAGQASQGAPAAQPTAANDITSAVNQLGIGR
jgi:hypothetical protein